MESQKRYTEIDYLRIVLIFAVFLHHCLMPFNGDNWHIMNNTSSKLLDDIMVYFEQLRLPLLFFIAGSGSYLLLERLSNHDFIFDKAKRLLLPLVIGVLFVVPPQHYFESPENFPSFLSALPELVLRLDSNHLWFIEFLLLFMVLAIPVKYVIAKLSTLSRRVLANFKLLPYLLLSFGIILGLTRVLFEKATDAEGHSLHNLALSGFYFLLFVLGMFFISHKSIWCSLHQFRRVFLGCFITVSIVFYAYYFPDYSAYFSLQTRWSIWWFVCTLLTWTGLLTALSYAQRYLRKSTSLLILGNRLIFPFYIFHQSVIVAVAYYVVHTDYALPIKALIVTLVSLLVTVLICRYIVYPFKPMRFLFGLKY
ncbi:acyltransferase family protein [Glaciecola sp. MH2013]|uniref:acyltransferase family protein n=1 Tax=Glaciecola sp. MH2013 TaxID=2785524 RepID=UPI00189E7E6E|nr:acyltransferase family protein [Glaciecola sp. MH2013]MBF7073401.1 acyltransferase family protein [Glaciecola sp. MH2013]